MSPLSPLGSWPAAKSDAWSVPVRMSEPVTALLRMSELEIELALIFDAVTAFVETFEPVTAW